VQLAGMIAHEARLSSDPAAVAITPQPTVIDARLFTGALMHTLTKAEISDDE
jgi:hypothetical protein